MQSASVFRFLVSTPLISLFLVVFVLFHTIITMEYVRHQFKNKQYIVVDNKPFKLGRSSGGKPKGIRNKGQLWVCHHEHDGCAAQLYIDMDTQKITSIEHHDWYTARWHDNTIDHYCMDKNEIKRQHMITRMIQDVRVGVAPKQAYRNDIIDNYEDAILLSGYLGSVEGHLERAKTLVTPKLPDSFDDIDVKFDENPEWQLNYYGLRNERIKSRYNLEQKQFIDKYKTEDDILKEIDGLQEH
eukprot:339798_1